MNNNPLVSVLMNCYNSSKFISRAIKSVLNQTYINWELIVWDDGSNDDTLEIVKSFRDKRIKLFSQKKNLGLGLSRINAIKKINGTLVSILDSDDFFEKEKIFEQVSIFKKNEKIALCATWAKFFDEHSNIISLFESNLDNNEIKKRLSFLNVLPHSSIMYKKNIAENCGWYSRAYEYSQDYDLSLKLIKKNEFYLIKKNLTNITQPLESMTNSLKYQLLRINENLDILKNNINNNHLSLEEKNMLANIIEIQNIKIIFLEKKNIFVKLIKILKIFLKNPLIFFKYHKIKQLSEKKKI